jgi:hypothetical protein
MLDRHARIGCMQTTDVLVVEPTAGANENFVQGPLSIIFHRVLR